MTEGVPGLYHTTIKTGNTVILQPVLDNIELVFLNEPLKVRVGFEINQLLDPLLIVI